jgi:hypothetical protein
LDQKRVMADSVQRAHQGFSRFRTLEGVKRKSSNSNADGAVMLETLTNCPRGAYSRPRAQG